MTSRELFEAYRRMFATAEDGVVCWWYTGVSYVALEHRPEIPVCQIAAIMTYRTETVSSDVFRVHWSEIGVFTHPVTGESSGTWENPLTGAVVQAPRSFFEGPGVYTVRAADHGIQLEVKQPGALVEELRVTFEECGDRFGFSQLERKTRSYPDASGAIPSLEIQPGLRALTELEFFTTKAALTRPRSEPLPVYGVYRFTLSGIPDWMGFAALPGSTRTLGSITRADHGQRVNPRAWRLLEERFPREIVTPTVLPSVS
jgi:hypothetical protein